MIGYIKGSVEGIEENSILLENNGIGYFIYTSGKVIEQLMQSGGEVKIYTYMHVREDELSLFGFLTKEELDTFKLLLSVNGIGPKAALAILSVLTVADLSYAVMSGDVKAITKANGIGAKGANRIIMELKDKLHYADGLTARKDTTMNGTKDGLSNPDVFLDTIMALVSLGYSELEAGNAVRQVEYADGMSSEELLKQALKKIF